MSKLRPMGILCLCYIQFMRNTPLLVQLYFVFYVLPLFGLTFDALATGIVGLGLGRVLINRGRSSADRVAWAFYPVGLAARRRWA
jgi:ABC-type amino acid transport system permease subunit